MNTICIFKFKGAFGIGFKFDLMMKEELEW